MFNQLMSSLSGEFIKNLTDKFGINDSQAQEAVSLAKDRVTEEVKAEAKGGNIAAFMNLFNGKQAIASSGLVNNIIMRYTGDLIKKLGFNTETASSISNFVIPYLMNQLNDKTPSTGLNKQDMEEIIGKDSISSLLGGVVGGSLGKLFGNK